MTTEDADCTDEGKDPWSLTAEFVQSVVKDGRPQFWHTIFGNEHPVEIEIGPGTGTFILAAAAAQPLVNFFGVEHSRGRAARLEAAIQARQLANAHVISADASCVVATLTPPESVSAYHIYFPDPWWKRRHHRRRLFTAVFTHALARTLVPDGRLYVATDVDELFEFIVDTLGVSAAFCEDRVTRSPRTGTTSFERKGLARGATIREATFVKRRSQLPFEPPPKGGRLFRASGDVPAHRAQHRSG